MNKDNKRKNKNKSTRLRSMGTRAKSVASSRRGEKKKDGNIFLDGAVSGKIDGNPNGFAFLIRDDFEKDVFISAKALNGAIHGDTVLAKLSQRQKGGFEAVVVKINEMSGRTLLGTYVKNIGAGDFVIPDDKRICCDVRVENAYNIAVENGDKVLIQLTGRRGGLFGKVTRAFKPSDNIDWDIFSVIQSHNLREEFSQQVQKEAAAIPDSPTAAEFEGRHDFRNTLAITIDGDDSRDFDDAVELTKKGDAYELCVHIADVAHYVKPSSELDKEAFKRGTSVYFPGSFISMLPDKICNNICSLMEGQDRLTLSVIMQINASGKVVKYKIVNGVIRSVRRMTYNVVEKILNGDTTLSNEYSLITPMLQLMSELAVILNKKRIGRGSVDFDLPESQIILDHDGMVKDVRRALRLTSHRIIEEFMLITNETVAEHMEKAVAPFVYRGHLPPTDLKLEAFSEFLAATSVLWDRSEPVVPMDYSRLLSGIPDNLSNIVNMMALRSMTKAAYFPANKGHFGLASEHYCHFTAPIRRYPDLMIHRIIKDYLSNGKKCFSKYTELVAEVSTHSSLTERQADEAERDVEDIYKARFMGTKIGEIFDGIISGVTEWGVYVQLANTVEGLVKKENLPNGDYFFNPVLMSLSNMSNIYKPGDSMKIKVLSVSKNKVDFIPAD